ncbi:4a-hydroxytetrahydrobiopterin dehydratase [Aquimarina sp. D1M17]|uniref:4a-hydroxytetrahydrobiopterin dehydratase n=1 Tax=Aquimarina acroporae TaxID=2937283 RepID=UPI0020C00681|nr:4a-hydroxytetrahydrobiopterin dehydratase [Aquimarina acroporae]MCK8520682.1 4a-hydroxytetrahydrobiopterin dehydratase [Aquimarina acroporae]
MKKLSESEIQEKLKTVDGWEYHENALHTTFEFNDFKDAFSVMTRIAFEAEIQQHHPDWSNVYNKLQISLSTHDAGGITENDFKLAKTIDQIIEGD